MTPLYRLVTYPTNLSDSRRDIDRIRDTKFLASLLFCAVRCLTPCLNTTAAFHSGKANAWPRRWSLTLRLLQRSDYSPVGVDSVKVVNQLLCCHTYTFDEGSQILNWALEPCGIVVRL